MVKESLKEMLQNAKSGDYDKIMKYVITQDDIKDFYELYSEFVIDEVNYQQMILERKRVAQDFIQKLELLRQMSELISRSIDIKKRHYEYAANNSKDLIIAESQYDKVFRVLKQLASDETTQYEIKTIKYTAYDSNERHGYRTTDEYLGSVTILAEKQSLNEIESYKKNYTIREMLENIYKFGYSMIIFGNDEYTTERLNLPNKRILGHYHPLVLYLQNDNLTKSISSFIEFINENGPDLDGIEANDLLGVLQQKYKSNSKKLMLK